MNAPQEVRTMGGKPNKGTSADQRLKRNQMTAKPKPKAPPPKKR